MQNRLLALGALCVAGTVNGALLGSATPLVVGLASNIFANDLGTVWDGVAKRLQGQDAVLQNEDLAKAVGRAIAAVIAQVAKEARFRDYQDPLRRLARRAESDWVALVQAADAADLAPLQEPNLVNLFAVNPTDFNQVTALTPEIWTDLLNTWQFQDPEVMRDAEVMGQVAQALHELFPKALREVLKEDFATGGRAFGALVLDLFGELHSTLLQQHDILLARIDTLAIADRPVATRELEQVTARLTELAAGNVSVLQTVAEQIESGFGDVTQLLAELGIQLAGTEARILEHQTDGFQRIEAKLDELEHPLLTIGVVIDSSRPKVSHWQGRAVELATLRQQLERVSLVGIPGLGGYGKSALANHLYETLDWPMKIWVTLSQPYRFSELGRWLLGKFGLQVEEQADDDALATVLTTCLAEHQCLVVLDNLETLLGGQGQWLLSGYERFLLKWLEHGRTSTILITSREQPQLPSSSNSYWHPVLTGLTVAEGAALLRDYGVVGDEATMQEFVALADGHPLLLGLAAALLVDELGEKPDIAAIKTTELNLFEIVGLHHGDPAASVNKLFTASFGRLEARLQQLLCCVSVYRIPFGAAAAAVMLRETALTWQEPATQRQVEQDLRQFAKRSLLQEAQRTAGTERRFQFLPLIAKYVRQQQSDWSWAHERAIFFYRAVAKASSWESNEDLREYFEAFHHYCELKQFALANDVLDLCQSFLSLRGYNRTQVELYGRLVQEWKPISLQDWSDFGWALMSLGNAYSFLGVYIKASDCHKKSLTIARNIGDHNGEAASLNSLGNIYNLLGKYVKAIAYYEHSLTISRDIGDHNGEAASLNNLGNAYRSLGDYTKAIEYYEHSLTISRDIGDHNGAANALGNLGTAYNALGNYATAIDYQEQALAISRDIGDRNGEAASLGNLGIAYNALGNYVTAIDYQEQALAISCDIGDRNGEASCLGNLGNAYQSLGEYGKAIEYQEQSLTIKRAIGDRNGAAIAWFNLGETLAKMDRVPDALEAYRNARQLFAEIQLEFRVQECDNALRHLSSAAESPRRKPRNPLVRLWQWFKRLVRSFLG